MEYFILLVTLIVIFFGWFLVVVRQNEVAVRERFGRFKDVLFPGWHFILLPGIIDRITKSKSGKDRVIVLKKFPIPIFREVDDSGRTITGESIDFREGTTARVTADLWVQIGVDGTDLETERGKDDITKAVKKFVYNVENSKERARKLVDELIRPILQGMTVDEALQSKSEITLSDPDKARIEPALLDIGLSLITSGECLTVGDIDLPPEVVAARLKLLVSEKEKEARLQQAIGIRHSAEILARGEENGKPKPQGVVADVSVKEALQIQQRLAAIEALKEADVRLVQSNSGAAVDALLDIAGQQRSSQQNQRPNRQRNRPTNP